LYLRSVQIIHIIRIWKRVGHELAHIVFIAVGVDVVQVFDLVRTEVVCARAHIIPARGIAVSGLVETVARTIHIVVPFCLDCVIVRIIVICVSRIYGELVVGFVLDERIEPTVTDQHVLQIDVVSSRDILRILVENVS